MANEFGFEDYPIVQVFKVRAKGRICSVDHEVFPHAGDLEDDGV